MPTVPPTLELLGGGNPEGDPPDSKKVGQIIEIGIGSVDTPLAPLEGFSVRTPPTDAVLAPTSNPPVPLTKRSRIQKRVETAFT